MAIQSAVTEATSSVGDKFNSENYASMIEYVQAVRGLDDVQKKAFQSSKELSDNQMDLIRRMDERLKVAKDISIQDLLSIDNLQDETVEILKKKDAHEKLNDELLKQLYLEEKIHKDDKEKIDNFLGERVPKANGSLSGSNTNPTSGLKASLTAFKEYAKTTAGMFNIAMTVGPIAIAILTRLYDAIVTTSEEYEERARTAHSELEAAKRQIEDYGAAIDKNRERIRELYALAKNGTIQLTEQEELDRLKQENIQLEMMIENQKILNEQKADDIDEDIKNAFENRKFEAENFEVTELSNAAKQAEKEWKRIADENGEGSKEALEAYKKYQTARDALISDGSRRTFMEDQSMPDYINSIVKGYQDLNNEYKKNGTLTAEQFEDMERYKGILAEQAITLGDWVSMYSADDDTKKELQGLLDIINKTVNTASYFNSQAEASTTWGNALRELAKDGEINAEKVDVLVGQYPELGVLMSELGYTAQDVASNFTTLTNEFDANATSAGYLADSLEKIKTASDLLKTLKDDIKDGNGISLDTSKAIIEQYGEMEDVLRDYHAGLLSADDVYAKLERLYKQDKRSATENILAQLQTSEEFYKKLGLGRSTLNNQLKEMYGIDLDNYKDLASAKLAVENEVLQKLSKSWGQFFGVQYESIEQYAIAVGSYDNSAIGSVLDRKDDKGRHEYNRLRMQVNNARKLLSGYRDTMNALKDIELNGIDTTLGDTLDLTDKDKSDSDEYIADIDRFREALERLARAEATVNNISLEIDKAANGAVSTSIDIGHLADEYERYAAELSAANDAKVNLDRTVYGNIDLNNRQILEWNDKNLDKYKDALLSMVREEDKFGKTSSEVWKQVRDEWAGSISTVIGSSANFDGLEIAFSPILQTADGPVLLSENTVADYIWSLLDKIRSEKGNWTSEDLFALDATGLEIDGKRIKCLLADIGDTAIATGEAMHYGGKDGSVAQAYRDLSESATLAGVSVEEAIDRIKSGNTVIHETKNYGFKDQIALQNALTSAYEDQRKAIEALNSQRKGYIASQAQYLRNMGFEVEYNDAIHQFWVSNLEHLNELPEAKRKDTEELVNSLVKLNEANREGAKDWRELGVNIEEAGEQITEILDKAVQRASESVDSIQDVYDTLKEAAVQYSESGHITVDTLQTIISMGPQYLAFLTDENGQLKINEESINNIIKARTEQLAIESALTYIEAIRIAKSKGETDALNDLLYATKETTNATWGLVYANLKLSGLSDEQYAAALKNINAMRALADNAIHSIGKTGKTVKEELEDMQNGMTDILEYVKDMIKSQIDQEIEAINEAVDAYSSVIEAKKESLRATKEEADYTKDMTKKVKEMAKLQAQIDMLSLDDSREAQAERAKLQEELAALQDELSDTQAEKAIEKQEEALDQMEKDYTDAKDEEIKILEDRLSSEEKLYREAISYIENNWDSLYDQLIAWNTEYGNVLNSEITSAWDECLKAAQKYGDYTAAMGKLPGDIESAGADTSNILGNSGGYGDPTSNTDMVRSIVNDMRAEGMKWATAADKNAIHNNVAKIASQLPAYGVNVDYKPASGKWIITSDSNNPGNKNKELLSCYHSGGIVGGGSLKDNEEFAKLQKNEWVLTDSMVDNVVAKMTRLEKLSNAFRGVFGGFASTSLFSSLRGAGNNETVNNVTNNTSKPIQITIGDTVIHGADKSTVAQHAKVSRDTVNEIARILGVKW